MSPLKLFWRISLDKVEHVDEVGVVDVPALDAHDVRKHVEVRARTHAAVEDDPETERKRARSGTNRPAARRPFVGEFVCFRLANMDVLA